MRRSVREKRAEALAEQNHRRASTRPRLSRAFLRCWNFSPHAVQLMAGAGAACADEVTSATKSKVPMAAVQE